MFETMVSRRRRVLRAAGILALNLVLWVIIPQYLGSLLSSSVPSTPLAIPAFIYTFGLIIALFQVVAALTEGMGISVPFVSAYHLVTAYYNWVVTQGGLISVAANGTHIVLYFTPLVYLILVSPLFDALRAPLAYLLQRRQVRDQGRISIQA